MILKITSVMIILYQTNLHTTTNKKIWVGTIFTYVILIKFNLKGYGQQAQKTNLKRKIQILLFELFTSSLESHLRFNMTK